MVTPSSPHIKRDHTRVACLTCFYFASMWQSYKKGFYVSAGLSLQKNKAVAVERRRLNNQIFLKSDVFTALKSSQITLCVIHVYQIYTWLYVFPPKSKNYSSYELKYSFSQMCVFEGVLWEEESLTQQRSWVVYHKSCSWLRWRPLYRVESLHSPASGPQCWMRWCPCWFGADWLA